MPAGISLCLMRSLVSCACALAPGIKGGSADGKALVHRLRGMCHDGTCGGDREPGQGRCPSRRSPLRAVVLLAHASATWTPCRHGAICCRGIVDARTEITMCQCDASANGGNAPKMIRSVMSAEVHSRRPLPYAECGEPGCCRRLMKPAAKLSRLPRSSSPSRLCEGRKYVTADAMHETWSADVCVERCPSIRNEHG